MKTTVTLYRHPDLTRVTNIVSKSQSCPLSTVSLILPRDSRIISFINTSSSSHISFVFLRTSLRTRPSSPTVVEREYENHLTSVRVHKEYPYVQLTASRPPRQSSTTEVDPNRGETASSRPDEVYTSKTRGLISPSSTGPLREGHFYCPCFCFVLFCWGYVTERRITIPKRISESEL